MTFPISVSRPVISLLHATWHREGGPIGVRNAWLEAARRPEHIEYVCALDESDSMAALQTKGLKFVIGPPTPRSSAVRNWNSAARVANGAYLFVIADDLLPPDSWDQQLLEKLGNFNPLKQAVVVKVGDTSQTGLNRVLHPVVSRAYYEKYGLFSEGYSHLFCDTDFSLRAARVSPIVDCREIVFVHQHPTEQPLSETKSQARGRTEFALGRAQFERDWSLFERIAGSGVTPSRLTWIAAKCRKCAIAIQALTAFSELPINLRREMRRIGKSRWLRFVRVRGRRFGRGFVRISRSWTNLP